MFLFFMVFKSQDNGNFIIPTETDEEIVVLLISLCKATQLSSLNPHLSTPEPVYTSVTILCKCWLWTAMEFIADGNRITTVSRSWDEGWDDGSTGYWAPGRKRCEEGVRAKEGAVGAQRPVTALHKK